MKISHTINLLKECNSGSKMAVASIDEVLDRIKNPKMKNLLIESKNHHAKLGNDIHEMLNVYHTKEKDPGLVATAMSWMKVNYKLMANESDEAIADLMVDGCDMGVKSLHKYLNEYSEADPTAKNICKRLVAIEEQLCTELRKYL